MNFLYCVVIIGLSGCSSNNEPQGTYNDPQLSQNRYQKTLGRPFWSQESLSGRPRKPNSSPVISIDTFYDKESRDECPRVNMKLTRRGKKEDVLAVAFDTGSDEVFVLDGTVSGNKHIGYNDGLLGTRIKIPQDLVFGIPGDQTGVVIDRVVKEHAELVDTSHQSVLKFDIELNIASSASERLSVDSGLLGAAKSSKFAKAAGLFAYLPPRVTGTDKGRILIGESAIDQITKLCKESIFMIGPEKDSEDLVLFVTEGSVSIENKKNPEPVIWAVDTGANGFHAPVKFRSQVLDLIKAVGGKIIPAFPGDIPIISNCRQTKNGYPTIHVRVGSTTVPIKPENYLLSGIPELNDDECALNILTGDLGAQGVHLLGATVLNNVITVFDADYNRVGVCNPK